MLFLLLYRYWLWFFRRQLKQSFSGVCNGWTDPSKETDDDEDGDLCNDDDVNSFLAANLSLTLGGWKYPKRLSSLVREEQSVVFLDSVDFDSAEASDDDMVVATVDASTHVEVDVDVDADADADDR